MPDVYEATLIKLAAPTADEHMQPGIGTAAS
jgi:hypothetical protein